MKRGSISRELAAVALLVCTLAGVWQGANALAARCAERCPRCGSAVHQSAARMTFALHP